MIDNFTGCYYSLSNFSDDAVEYDGGVWKTSEAAFQAAKTDSADYKRKIMDAKTPAEAKRLGREAPMRADWEDIKDQVMFDIIYSKFSGRDDLKMLLLATNNAELVEGNKWHDNYWGNCKCRECANIKGKNQLGKTLMEVRELLRKEVFGS